MKIRLGSVRRMLRAALVETDERMMGDDAGPDNKPEDDISDHLRDDEEKMSLGDHLDETFNEHAMLRRELRKYFLQEGPPGASAVDPREPQGAYSPFDMTRDHTGTDDLSSTWYKSPGRPVGTEGDPYRSEDPNAQLGFHPPNSSGGAPPAAAGEEGTQARLAPPIWQLSAGSDTSKVLGANAKPDTGGEESGDEQEEDAEDGDGTDTSAEQPDGEAEGEEQDGSRAQGGRN